MFLTCATVFLYVQEWEGVDGGGNFGGVNIKTVVVGYFSDV